MIVVVLLGLGLILGSFVNAFVWRLHEHKNWLTGRSECPHCHHRLAAKDMVPVMSYLVLRGRCRYCGKKIDDSPLVELAVPALFVASYLFWPLPLNGDGLFQLVVWLALIVGFVALALYDFRWFLLPNKLVFPLVGLAAAQLAARIVVFHESWHILLGAGLGVLLTAGVFYVLFQISKGTWIGGGDVKLCIALGALAGSGPRAVLLLLIASLAATLATAPFLLAGKANRKSHIPFGPFLALGLVVTQLFGQHIIGWYAGLFV